MQNRWLGFLSALLLGGCDVLFGDGNNTPVQRPRGLNESCTQNSNCRFPLFCDVTTGTCRARGDLASGAMCTLTAECGAGLVCTVGTCGPAGPGGPEDPCGDTPGCQRGLVCLREPGNLFGVCRLPRRGGAGGDGGASGDGGVTSGDSGGVQDGGPPGDGGSPPMSFPTDVGQEVGGPCTDVLDCLPGLLCVARSRTCQPPALGMGAGFPAPWPGDRCETVPGPVKALFELPGADGAPRHDFFRLPFPNDVRRDPSTGRLNLTGFPHPGNALLGFDLVDRYARALERSTDGFGTQTFVTFRFSGRVNFATLRLNDTIRMVDLTTGEGTPALRFSATTDRNAYLCPNPVFVDTGVPLEPGHTYAAWLTTGVQVDGGGAAVARDEDFNAVLAMEPPADPVRARAHAAYAPFRRYLQARMIDPATVLVAAVFTTQRPRAQVPALREAVRALPPGMAPEFVRCDVGVRSPCDDGLTGSAHVRGCVGAPDPRFHEYQGLVEFPVFQRGTRPYRTPGEGELALDAMGRAMPQGTERVCVTVTLPRDTPAPMDGFPVVLYAHGTGGSTRSAVAEGLAGAFARVDLGGGRAGAFATVTWDGVMHGPRRGMGVTDSPDVLFFNFANPEAARDNILQGAADLFAMVRALPTLRLPSPTGMGTVSLDRRRAVFLGHSQGGTVGLPAAAFEPDLAALVFSGTGGDLRASLTTKRRPIDIASLVPVVLQDRGVGINHPALNLFQAYFERSDAANYARAILAERPMGVPLRPVVQVYGLGDTYSTVETMQAVAVSLGIPAAGPIPGGMRAFPSGMGLPFPVMANYADSTGRTTAALLESDPGSAYDGHFVLFRDLALQQRVAVFLATAVEGMAVLR